MASRITSDLAIDAAKFDPENVSPGTIQLKEALKKITLHAPKWQDVGIARFRQMQESGETALPPPVLLPGASDIIIPSRDEGRDIEARVYKPDNGASSKGIVMHIHGGGFIIGSHRGNDELLQMYANKCQVTAISVNYRHAPEDPHPAAVHDCFDAAEFLVDHSEEEFGAKLLFVTGHSSGGNLAALTAFQLLRSRASHQLAGLMLHYPLGDCSISLPQSSTYTAPLMITTESTNGFMDVYLPNQTLTERRHPSKSPLYEDLQSLAAAAPGRKLPPVIFHCGTDDLLLDDSILLCAKWQMTGSEAILKLYPGSPHGFDTVPGKETTECKESNVTFVTEKL